MRDTLYPLSQCPYCPLARPAGEIRFIEDTYYERWGSHLLGTYRRYSISCTLCNRSGDTIAEGFTSLEAAITAARGHAKHHNENYAEEHANGHPRQPPNKPQPLPQPPQRIPIAQAPARYGGTWWAVCHLPTCYWIHQASNWDEAANNLSIHVFEHQIGDPHHS